MELEEAASRLMMKLYGNKWCETCQAIRPIRTYMLEGTLDTNLAQDRLTTSFTGSQVCQECNTPIKTPESGVKK